MWRVLVVALVSVVATAAYQGPRPAPGEEAALQRWLLLGGRPLQEHPSLSAPPTATPSPASLLQAYRPLPHPPATGQLRALLRSVSGPSLWGRVSRRLRREIRLRGPRWGKSLGRSGSGGRHSHESALRTGYDMMKRRFLGRSATNSINSNEQQSDKEDQLDANDKKPAHRNSIVDNKNKNRNDKSRGSSSTRHNNAVPYSNRPQAAGTHRTPAPLHRQHQTYEPTTTITTTTLPPNIYHTNRVSSSVENTNTFPTSSPYLESIEPEEEEGNPIQMAPQQSEFSSIEAPFEAVVEVAARDESLDKSVSQPLEENLIASVEQDLYNEAAETEPVVEEVFEWGRHCFHDGENITARRHRDSVLHCELWAPLGSVTTWRRDGQTLREDNTVSTYGVAEGVYSTAPVQLIISSFFLDCASYDQQGEYELVVTTLSGKTFARQFKVTIEMKGWWWDPIARSCYMLPIERRLLPRIHAWSRIVYATEGTSLTLPCHYDGYLMTVTWFHEDKMLQKDMVTQSGELVITDLGRHNQGKYTCLLSSSVMPPPHHQKKVFTAVWSQDKMEL